MRSVSARTRYAAIAAALVLLVLLGWLATRVLTARSSLAEARSDLGVAREALRDGRFDAARAALDSAARETAVARAAAEDPVWAAAATVPLAGRSLKTSRGIAFAADDVARRVLPGAVQAANGLDPRGLRAPDGRVDLAVVTAARAPLATAAAQARAVERDVDALPATWLLGPVSAARAELQEQAGTLASALDAAAATAEIAPALLGQDRPRRYLLLVQQPSESRGTGGLIGGYAVLEVADGRVTVRQSGSNNELRGGVVEPPPGLPEEFVERYSPEGTFDMWVNVNLSPDLPTVAKVAQAKWTASGGPPIDGVGVIDPIGLASLLRGAPPIDVGDGRMIAPADLPEYLAVGQYVGLEVTDQAERKERLGAVSDAALGRLARGGGDTGSLVRGLAEAIGSGHLRFASDDPALMPVLRRTGVDGALPEGPAPVAYPVVWNATGGKLEHFLDRSIRYEAGSCTGARRTSRIEVRLRETPPKGLPPYLTVRFGDEGRGDSSTGAVTLNVYGTRDARLVSASMDGVPLQRTDELGGAGVREDAEAGMPVWTTLVDLPPGQERTLVLEVDEPVVPGAARVPEQPLARPLVRQVDVPVCGAGT